MSTGDEHHLHPNLADALEEGAPDAAALDALARRLGALEQDPVLPAPPADLFARIEAATAEPAPAPTALASRRPSWRSSRVLAMAAALVAIVGVGAGLLWPEGDPEPQVEEVALEGLAGFEQSAGRATLVVEGDRRSVAVDLTSVEVPAGSHLELWLLDEAVEQLVPLGEVAGPSPHELPAHVDLTATPIVDVSLEPDDGDPAHSGVSVVRGTLD